MDTGNCSAVEGTREDEAKRRGEGRSGRTRRTGGRRQKVVLRSTKADSPHEGHSTAPNEDGEQPLRLPHVALANGCTRPSTAPASDARACESVYGPASPLALRRRGESARSRPSCEASDKRVSAHSTSPSPPSRLRPARGVATDGGVARVNTDPGADKAAASMRGTESESNDANDTQRRPSQ
jgi:hypothetical protein